MYSPSVCIDSQTLPGPIEHWDKCWYAAQTGANQEKLVTSRLVDRGIEAFLPLYEEARKRTDRTIVVQLPLFRGYTFVRIALRDRIQVLHVPRVVRLVGNARAPIRIPDADIAALQGSVASGSALPHPYLQAGRRVTVISGAFQGMTGIITRRKSSLRLVVTIEAIQRSFAIEVDAGDVTATESTALFR